MLQSVFVCLYKSGKIINQGNLISQQYMEPNLFSTECEEVGVTAKGFGPSKKAAKRCTAEEMLPLLEEIRASIGQQQPKVSGDLLRSLLCS